MFLSKLIHKNNFELTTIKKVILIIESLIPDQGKNAMDEFVSDIVQDQRLMFPFFYFTLIIYPQERVIYHGTTSRLGK